MRYFFAFFLLCFALTGFAQPDTSQKAVPNRRNSTEQQQKPYVILISVDGFRYDYAEKHGATFLQSFAKEGVRAASMIPSFPSLTFPNHYTIATGLYPSHHGLVDNRFYEPVTGEEYSMSKADKVRSGKWYGGTPLWVLAEQQQMLSASYFWVGTEAPIKATPATYYYLYNEVTPIEKRIETVVNWLRLPAEQRPHFISFYFPEVDHKGHSYGPDASQTGAAVRWVDSAIYRLTEEVKKTGLPVNFIVVSDHGMTNVDTVNKLRLPFIDTSKAVVIPGSEIAHIYVKEKTDIKSLYRSLKKGAEKYTVFLKKKMPARLHYGRKDDAFGRIGDILLIPDWPQIFVAQGARAKPGAHGFDPYKVKDMHALFYAWGPAFKKGTVTNSVRNVDVYPVVTKILGLPYQHKIDGRKNLAKDILVN